MKENRQTGRIGRTRQTKQTKQTKHIRYNGINGIIGKIQSRKLQTLEIRVSLCLEGLECLEKSNPNPISIEIGIITEFGKNQWLVTSYIDKSVKLPIMGTKNQAIDALIDILENEKKEEMKGMKE